MDKTSGFQFRVDTMIVTTASAAILVWGVMHWQAHSIRDGNEFNRLWWESKTGEPYEPSDEMSERLNAWKSWQIGLADLAAAVGLVGMIAYVVRRRVKQRKRPTKFEQIHVPEDTSASP